MNDIIKSAFDDIHAEDTLKNNTRAFIIKKSRGYKQRKPLAVWIVPVCSALILFVSGWLFLVPTARINIDINPSIELGVNRFDKVVSVNPLNDDGRILANSLDIFFADYDTALNRILDNDNIKSLLAQNEVMDITVIETNNSQFSNILSDSRSCADKISNVYCHSANLEEAHAAVQLGMSCGKYRAYLEVQKLDPNITPEEIQNMTMREIRELIRNLSGDDSVIITGAGHYGGHSNGHSGSHVCSHE